jgi:hypothetical protein
LINFEQASFPDREVLKNCFKNYYTNDPWQIADFSLDVTLGIPDNRKVFFLKGPDDLLLRVSNTYRLLADKDTGLYSCRRGLIPRSSGAVKVLNP